MNFNNYLDIISFNIVFNDFINARSELDIKIILKNDEMFYIMLVDLLYLI